MAWLRLHLAGTVVPELRKFCPVTGRVAEVPLRRAGTTDRIRYIDAGKELADVIELEDVTKPFHESIQFAFVQRHRSIAQGTKEEVKREKAALKDKKGKKAAGSAKGTQAGPKAPIKPRPAAADQPGYYEPTHEPADLPEFTFCDEGKFKCTGRKWDTDEESWEYSFLDERDLSATRRASTTRTGLRSA